MSIPPVPISEWTDEELRAGRQAVTREIDLRLEKSESARVGSLKREVQDAFGADADVKVLGDAAMRIFTVNDVIRVGKSMSGWWCFIPRGNESRSDAESIGEAVRSQFAIRSREWASKAADVRSLVDALQANAKAVTAAGKESEMSERDECIDRLIDGIRGSMNPYNLRITQDAVESAYDAGHADGQLHQMGKNGTSQWMDQWKSKCEEVEALKLKIMRARRELA
jgi:hypothetical protein